jgi:pimeloyl-ACP methyl ester carboxylesterase
MKKIISTYLIIIIVCVLFNKSVFAQNSPFDTTLYGRNEKAGKFAELRGIKMYYEIYGTGEPLLIIHGNSGSINNFLYQIPYFSQHYKVIVADSRAQGKTKDNGDSLSYEMMADDLAALLDNLGIDSCNVIGWSDGGINGLLLAMRHPKKVKKLAITGANLWPDSTAIHSFAYQWAIKMNKDLDKEKQTAEIKNTKKLFRLLSFEPHISLADLKKIECPTLVMGGDHDVILPEHTLLIAKNISKSYLWLVPNSGHSVPIFYKDQFNTVVHDFFKNAFRFIQGPATFN